MSSTIINLCLRTGDDTGIPAEDALDIFLTAVVDRRTRLDFDGGRLRATFSFLIGFAPTLACFFALLRFFFAAAIVPAVMPRS